MNRLTKAMAVATAAALIGFGGLATTSANAATDDEIANYLAEAVAAQLGIANSDSLRELIADAMANSLLDPSLTGAAGNTVDGVSTLTAEEFAALLDSNLTQQLSAIEQALLDLGVTTEPEVPGVTPEEDDDAYEEDDEAYEEDDDAYEEDDDSYEEDEDEEELEDELDDELEDDEDSDDLDEDEDEVDDED